MYIKVPSLTHFFTLFIQPLWLCHLKELNQIPPLCWWHPVIHLFHSFTVSNSTTSLEILSNTFSHILSWMNSNKLFLNPSNTEFILFGTKHQRLKFSQLRMYLLISNNIIPVSSSARIILASSSILTYLSQIKSTPCLNLVIFIPETSVVYVIPDLLSFSQLCANIDDKLFKKISSDDGHVLHSLLAVATSVWHSDVEITHSCSQQKPKRPCKEKTFWTECYIRILTELCTLYYIT